MCRGCIKILKHFDGRQWPPKWMDIREGEKNSQLEEEPVTKAQGQETAPCIDSSIWSVQSRQAIVLYGQSKDEEGNNKR